MSARDAALIIHAWCGSHRAEPARRDALGRISDTLGRRRLSHGAETLEDGAEAYGAKTPEEFAAFVQAAISDAEHQELLARALTIAQDTAMRDKRRALRPVRIRS